MRKKPQPGDAHDLVRHGQEVTAKLQQTVARSKNELLTLIETDGPSYPERVLFRNRLAGALEELDIAIEEIEVQNSEMLSLHEILAVERHRYRELFERAPICLITTDLGGIILEANLAAVHMLQVGQDALVGRPMAFFLATGEPAPLAPHLKTLRNGGEVHEWVAHLSPRGGAPEPIWIDLSAQVNESGTLVAVRWAVKKIDADALEALARHRLMDLLLAGLSHDLRSPLTIIAGNAELLLKYPEMPESPRIFAAIARGAESMNKILNDLLDLDRLRQGAVQVDARPTDIAPLVAQVIARIGDARLAAVVPPLVATVDAMMLERILDNLTRNALKFSPNGSICVRAAAEPGGLLVSVDDEGPGVPEADKRIIFEAFERGSAPTGTPGTGMGLALCARFAELHDGRAWVEDRPEGGASFKILLGAHVEEIEA